MTFYTCLLLDLLTVDVKVIQFITGRLFEIIDLLLFGTMKSDRKCRQSLKREYKYEI